MSENSTVWLVQEDLVPYEELFPEIPPLPSVNPAWLSPLCDVHTEEELYVWYKLVDDGSGDLYPDACGHETLGGPPEWAKNEDDLGLDTTLSPEWRRSEERVEGHNYSFTETWTIWGLENGIAPGQPFLVRIGKPIYSYSYWDHECDVEWEVNVVRVLPRTPERAARAWERFTKNVQAHRKAWIQRDQERRRRQDTDTEAYVLRSERYGFDHDGIRVSLCSKHTTAGIMANGAIFGTQLCSGDDPDGNYMKAFRSLMENIKKYRPSINLPAVVALAKGQAGVTRWEHFLWGLDDAAV